MNKYLHFQILIVCDPNDHQNIFAFLNRAKYFDKKEV